MVNKFLSTARQRYIVNDVDDQTPESDRDREFSDPDETGLRRGTGRGLFSSIAARLWD